MLVKVHCVIKLNLKKNELVTEQVTVSISIYYQDFHSLAAVWKHSNLPKQRKSKIVMACVASKLLYGLESLWMLQAELQRLDSFFVRCLRKIGKIPLAFYSRVPNRDVLNLFDAVPLSSTLRKRQLILYGKLARDKVGSLTRQVAIQDGCFKPRDWKPVRRVGRPCQRWPENVFKSSPSAFGSELKVQELLDAPDPLKWRSAVLNIKL